MQQRYLKAIVIFFLVITPLAAAPIPGRRKRFSKTASEAKNPPSELETGGGSSETLQNEDQIDQQIELPQRRERLLKEEKRRRKTESQRNLRARKIQLGLDPRDRLRPEDHISKTPASHAGMSRGRKDYLRRKYLGISDKSPMPPEYHNYSTAVLFKAKELQDENGMSIPESITTAQQMHDEEVQRHTVRVRLEREREREQEAAVALQNLPNVMHSTSHPIDSFPDVVGTSRSSSSESITSPAMRP